MTATDSNAHSPFLVQSSMPTISLISLFIVAASTILTIGVTHPWTIAFVVGFAAMNLPVVDAGTDYAPISREMWSKDIVALDCPRKISKEVASKGTLERYAKVKAVEAGSSISSFEINDPKETEWGAMISILRRDKAFASNHPIPRSDDPGETEWDNIMKTIEGCKEGIPLSNRTISDCSLRAGAGRSMKSWKGVIYASIVLGLAVGFEILVLRWGW